MDVYVSNVRGFETFYMCNLSFTLSCMYQFNQYKIMTIV